MGQQTSRPATTTASTAGVDTYDEKRNAAVSTMQQTKATADRLKGQGGPAGLTQDLVQGWQRDFENSPTLQLSQLILTSSNPISSLTSRQKLIEDKHIFNTALKGLPSNHKYPGPITSQNNSGRCWLFASTNCLRYRIMAKLNLESFELSQSYVFFCDKLEKCNYFLENMIDLADEPLDSRLVSTLTGAPYSDGGQAAMAVNIFEKYGVVPKALYPESFSSSASSPLNSLLFNKLREYSLELRSLVDGNLHDANVVASARARKQEMMQEVYNTLCITLGTPPPADKPFTYDFYDKDGKYQKLEVSPLDFYHKYTGPYLFSDCISIINDPRNSYEKLYTVDRLGNVHGGLPVEYVNAPISALEKAVIDCIKADQPVFFGCDSGADMIREPGVWDTSAIGYEKAFGYKLNMNKEERIRTGSSAMTHAMVITAVHVDSQGKPVRYRIENSWGEAMGDKGFFMMTADWFREYVYQVVVPKKLAEDKWVKIAEGGKAMKLPLWDPMGALA